MTLDFNNVNIFAEPDPLQVLIKERNETLNQYKELEAQEEQMRQLLGNLQAKKIDISRQAQKLRFEIQDLERKAALEQAEKEKLELLKSEAIELEVYLEKLNNLCEEFPAYNKAREYQKEDLVFSLKAFLDGKSGILNANDMSMGKTYEAIILLYCIKILHPDWKVLWLTKKSLTISTPKEIKKWWPESHLVTSAVAGTVKERNFVLQMVEYGADILVANYEFIRTTPKVMNIKWNVLVVDEAHKLKGGSNPGGPTDIWVKARELCAKTDFKIFLTGTPMVNRAEEMWAYLHLFSPIKFPNLRHFQNNFMQYKSFSRDFKMEVQATKLLQQALKGQMFRRTCEEVKLQLPDIQKEIIELDMHPDQRFVYNQMKEKFFIWLDEQEGVALTATAILAQLIRLRQINVWPSNIKFGLETLNVPYSSKIDEAMEIIDRVAEQTVVFCNFNEPLFEIQRRCRKEGVSCTVLYGDNSNEVSKFEVGFQQGEIQILCMNSAVGEGLNLHKDAESWPGGARYGIMLDKWYNDARNNQCFRRIVRPGSTDKGAFYILENVNSVDAFINQLCEEKTASFDSITESSTIRPDWKMHLEGLI